MDTIHSTNMGMGAGHTQTTLDMAHANKDKEHGEPVVDKEHMMNRLWLPWSTARVGSLRPSGPTRCGQELPSSPSIARP